MLKKSHVIAAGAVMLVAALAIADTSPPTNQIEDVTVRVTYRTGEMQPQYFTKQLGYKIKRIFDCRQNPEIWGSVVSTGLDTTILIHEIHASGYPGNMATSDITCKVMR